MLLYRTFTAMETQLEQATNAVQKAKLRAQLEVAQKKRIAAIRVLREVLDEDRKTTKELMNTTQI